MARKYEKVQKLLPEVQRLTDEGYTHRQIAEKLDLGSRKVVGQLLYRERHEKVKGIPKQRGRKPKPAETLEEYKKENQRLKMENELLRDFLSLTGRK